MCMKSPTKKLQKIKVMAINDHLYRKNNYECSHVKVCTYPKQVKIQINSHIYNKLK